MNERTAGRLELAGVRARTLFRSDGTPVDTRSTTESHESARGDPGSADEKLIAARIMAGTTVQPVAADAIAAEIVTRAKAALEKLLQGSANTGLTETEAMALESVILVRGRPAIRVLGSRLESLSGHPGSEFWQEFIATYESRIVEATSLTGAVVVSSFSSGNPPWTQGSAWLIARDRVVTNRHVLLPRDKGIPLVESDGAGSPYRLRADQKLAVDFAKDDRKPSSSLSRRVTGVLYVAAPQDPVDIAVLSIDSNDGPKPLALAAAGAELPENLFVIGHPAPVFQAPPEVQAVFGTPDGRKRVSFGKRLDVAGIPDIVHDASTIGGFSGGPVVGFSSGEVSGLHYYGDPGTGNLAVPAHVIRAHAAHKHMVASP